MNHAERRFLPYTIQKRHNGRYLLVLGLARSGTSFLASLLGGHPDINMLSECFDAGFTRLIGKQYAGNKLCIHQIRYDAFSPVPLRVVKTGSKNRAVCRMLIQDYLSLDAKIIIILRNTEDVINSMVNRTACSYDWAETVVNSNIKELNKVIDGKCHVVGYSSLCENKVNELKEICKYLGLEYSDRMLLGENKNWVYPERNCYDRKNNE